MLQITTVAELRNQIAIWRQSGARIAFVPTMGNLHEGHIELVRTALQSASRVVVSIFVNPLQFGPQEDFARYPRTLIADLNQLTEAGAHLAFMPPVEQMYPESWQGVTRIEVPGISDMLCGAHRPGHFSGVATVVAKLFNMVGPDYAFFGEKDFQQLRVIQRMVRDLAMPIDVRGVATVREPSGLALSSRNGYLTASERKQAPSLYRTLTCIRDKILSGDRDFVTLEAWGMAELRQEGFSPQYVSIRRASDLALPGDGEKDAVVFGAAYLGKTRLIDNVRVRP